MADAGFFRGTSADQDGRFKDKEKKLLKTMKFEDALEKKIDMSRVNLDVLKPWITQKINDLLGMEDDVVVEYVIGQLESKEINPKLMQINITGFLNARHSREFMGELWALMDEAQNAPDGIPPSMVEKKLNEMGKEQRRREAAVKKEADEDWSNRFASVSGGRYTGVSIPPNKEKEKEKEERREKSRSRERTPPRRRAYDEEEKKKKESDEETLRRRKEREERRMREKEEEKRVKEKEEERRREERRKERRRERDTRDDRRKDRRDGERDRERKRRESRSRSRSSRRRMDERGKKRKVRSRENSVSDGEKREERKREKEKKKKFSTPPPQSSSSSSSDSSDSSSSSSDSE